MFLVREREKNLSSKIFHKQISDLSPESVSNKFSPETKFFMFQEQTFLSITTHLDHCYRPSLASLATSCKHQNSLPVYSHYYQFENYSQGMTPKESLYVILIKNIEKSIFEIYIYIFYFSRKISILLFESKLKSYTQINSSSWSTISRSWVEELWQQKILAWK